MSKSSAYPPLDGLFDLACRDGVDIRPTLLRVLTDLYVQKPTHSAEEETQYVELALGLIEAVDASTRATVAVRLSAYPAAPMAVLQRLGGGSAPRASVPSPAKTQVGAPVDLAVQFFTAGADERRLILTNLDVASAPVNQPPAPASADMLRQLEAAALGRKVTEFSRLLEAALGIGHDVAARIVHDHSGEPIVVAAKALGMPVAVVQRVLLFLDPVIGQSVALVYELSRLYNEISYASAARMLTIWRGSAKHRRPVHAPQPYDDERRRAHPPTSAVRPGSQSQTPGVGRTRSGIR